MEEMEVLPLGWTDYLVLRLAFDLLVTVLDPDVTMNDLSVVRASIKVDMSLTLIASIDETICRPLKTEFCLDLDPGCRVKPPPPTNHIVTIYERS